VKTLDLENMNSYSLTHKKKPQDLKEVEKLTKLKDLCHESLSVHDHKHGNNIWEKNYHS